MSSPPPPLRIRATLQGKQLFITGATGFLGLALVERLLREVPECRLVLLVRSRDSQQATERFRTLIADDPLFRTLPLASLARVRCVAGDLTAEDLGMAPAERAALLGQVDLCINSAASVDFDEPLDAALRINIEGPLALQAFAREAGAALLQISTAYVCGGREGLIPDTLAVAALPDSAESAALALQELRDRVQQVQAQHAAAGSNGRRLTQALMQAGRELANARGWPDIYTYTKFLAERLLAERRDGRRLAIFRPSIIESPAAGACPGWLRGVKVMDMVLAAYGKGVIPGLPVDLDAPIDIIPVDMVANAVLAQAAALLTERDGSEVMVCQLGSSATNPLLLRRVVEFTYAHYRAHPLPDAQGRPIRVRRPKVRRLRNHLQWVERGLAWLAWQQSVLERHRWLPFSAGWRRRVLGRQKNLKRYLALAKMFGSYVHSRRQFGVERCGALLARLDAQERVLFDFDPAGIDWRDYLLQRHLPGLDRLLLSSNGNGQRHGAAP